MGTGLLPWTLKRTYPKATRHCSRRAPFLFRIPCHNHINPISFHQDRQQPPSSFSSSSSPRSPSRPDTRWRAPEPSVIQFPVCRVWPPNHLHNSGLESCKCIRKWRTSAPDSSSPGRSNKRSRRAARGSETEALGRTGSRAPIGNDTQDGARRRASGGQPRGGVKTSSAADEGLTGGSWVWIFFRWRPRGNPGSPEACDALAGGPSSPATATTAVTVVRGHRGTHFLPFPAADSSRACGRIMPRTTWGWADRAMQRSFPLPGASRRLEALGRKEATAAVPHRGFIGLACTAHPTEGARQRGADASLPEARGQKQGTQRGKGEGGGRRGVDLSGCTACPCKRAADQEALAVPCVPLLFPPTHDGNPLPTSQRFAFYPPVEATR